MKQYTFSDKWSIYVYYRSGNKVFEVFRADKGAFAEFRTWDNAKRAVLQFIEQEKNGEHAHLVDHSGLYPRVISY